MRKEPFTTGEYYHVFNRGTDKRTVFTEPKDMERFLQSMQEFNQLEPIGSLYENHLRKKNGHPMSTMLGVGDMEKLGEIICYCLNPNHFHFILKQTTEKGIEKFMQRLGNGYTKYFNHKNERSGVLFQGRYKAVHLSTNDILLYVSAYVNCNSEIHNIEVATKYPWCSYSEYVVRKDVEFCEKQDILGQFGNSREYVRFCQEKVIGMKDRKDFEKYKSELLEV